ncbi:MAG: hypothetical protein EAZ30_15545 [Betaproteobacteria bacterium]|nr:MAG: hypothetical protein EAZ30_15545 [Betaproteobacteria bacterium]
MTGSFFVGVYCPLEELERRELTRGDRRIGEAKADFETTHRFCAYDMEVWSTLPADENARNIAAAWKNRPKHNSVERIARYQSV